MIVSKIIGNYTLCPKNIYLLFFEKLLDLEYFWYVKSREIFFTSKAYKFAHLTC